MKNKKIIFLSLGLLLIVTTLVISIAAWLTDTEDTSPAIFTIGEIKYEFGGELKTFTPLEPIVPGQELVNNTIKLNNQSTVKSQIRVKITVIVNDGETQKAYDPSDLFQTEALVDGFSLATNWNYNSDDEFWYYSVNANDVLPANSGDITLLEHLWLDGSKVGNDFNSQVISIQFTFQAKQAEHVTWEQLGLANIDFSTGLAN